MPTPPIIETAPPPPLDEAALATRSPSSPAAAAALAAFAAAEGLAEGRYPALDSREWRYLCEDLENVHRLSAAEIDRALALLLTHPDPARWADPGLIAALPSIVPPTPEVAAENWERGDEHRAQEGGWAALVAAAAADSRARAIPLTIPVRRLLAAWGEARPADAPPAPLVAALAEAAGRLADTGGSDADWALLAALPGATPFLWAHAPRPLPPPVALQLALVAPLGDLPRLAGDPVGAAMLGHCLAFEPAGEPDDGPRIVAAARALEAARVPISAPRRAHAEWVLSHLALGSPAALVVDERLRTALAHLLLQPDLRRDPELGPRLEAAVVALPERRCPHGMLLAAVAGARGHPWLAALDRLGRVDPRTAQAILRRVEPWQLEGLDAPALAALLATEDREARLHLGRLLAHRPVPSRRTPAR